eukprot:82339_1
MTLEFEVCVVLMEFCMHHMTVNKRVAPPIFTDDEMYKNVDGTVGKNRLVMGSSLGELRLFAMNPTKPNKKTFEYGQQINAVITPILAGLGFFGTAFCKSDVQRISAVIPGWNVLVDAYVAACAVVSIPEMKWDDSRFNKNDVQAMKNVYKRTMIPYNVKYKDGSHNAPFKIMSKQNDGNHNAPSFSIPSKPHHVKHLRFYAVENRIHSLKQPMNRAMNNANDDDTDVELELEEVETDVVMMSPKKSPRWRKRQFQNQRSRLMARWPGSQ